MDEDIRRHVCTPPDIRAGARAIRGRGRRACGFPLQTDIREGCEPYPRGDRPEGLTLTLADPVACSMMSRAGAAWSRWVFRDKLVPVLAALQGGRRAVPDRQEIRTTIGWSPQWGEDI